MTVNPTHAQQATEVARTQRSSKFVINLKAAKQIGLTIPVEVLNGRIK